MRKLSEYQPVLTQILHLIAKETRFRCRPGLAEILKENPRLVVALSHGTPLSWFPAIALLTQQTVLRGGEHRHPMGVLDNFFFQIPLMKELARYLSQADRPLSYQELADRFENQGDIDLVLFPEGSNCFFGPADQIQEFRSAKFVELSIRTGAPLLLGVHHGSEHWAKAVAVPDSMLKGLDYLPKFASTFLEQRLRRSGLLVLPLLPTPMDRFEMLCELYRPKLQLAELSDDADLKKAQLKREAEQIRQQMIELLNEIKISSASASPLDPQAN